MQSWVCLIVRSNPGLPRSRDRSRARASPLHLHTGKSGPGPGWGDASWGVPSCPPPDRTPAAVRLLLQTPTSSSPGPAAPALLAAEIEPGFAAEKRQSIPRKRPGKGRTGAGAAQNRRCTRLRCRNFNKRSRLGKVRGLCVVSCSLGTYMGAQGRRGDTRFLLLLLRPGSHFGWKENPTWGLREPEREPPPLLSSGHGEASVPSVLNPGAPPFRLLGSLDHT